MSQSSAVLLSLIVGSQTAAVGTLEERLRSTIAASGADVAVAMRTLDGRAEVFVQADTRFHAASTMKVPVMIELSGRRTPARSELSGTRSD